MEYMIEVGKLARKNKILNLMHSNGYVNPKPLEDLCDCLDAACIDLKGFTEGILQGNYRGDPRTRSGDAEISEAAEESTPK